MRIYLTSGVLLLSFFLPYVCAASQTNGTIDTTFKYAWSNNVGWVNFAVSAGNVHVTDTALTGYAWSTTSGWINLSPTMGGVTNTGEGVLGGFAWGASLGWIDFSGVTIDASGRLHGTATGAGVGTLTFDCTNCRVVTDWRPVSARPPTPSEGTGTSGGSTRMGGGTLVTPHLLDAGSNFGAGGTLQNTNPLFGTKAEAASDAQETRKNLFDVELGILSLQGRLTWIPLALGVFAGLALLCSILLGYRKPARPRRRRKAVL